MQFTSSAAAFLALVSSVLAQTTPHFDAITTPTDGQTLQAGQTYSITWDPTAAYNEDTITIRLMQGADAGTLDFNPTNIATSVNSSLGSYSWTVDSSLVGFATYGLQIQLDKDTTIYQYSSPFHIAGDKTSSSTSTLISSTASPTPTSVSSVSTSSSSSVAVTMTTSTSSAASSATLVSTGGSGNLSTTGSASTTAGQTTLTTATKPSSTGSAPASTTSLVQTAGAGKIAAGTFAAIGGIVAAVLAL